MNKKIFFIIFALMQRNFIQASHWQNFQEQYQISDSTEFFVRCPLLVDYKSYIGKINFENCSVKIKQDGKTIDNPALEQNFLDLFNPNNHKNLARVSKESKFIWLRNSILPNLVTRWGFQWNSITMPQIKANEKR